MLLQFNFSNFKSFAGETSLDLRASGVRELGSHTREQGKDKVLPLAVIYGANASGKSKLYEAFEFMTDYVLRSFSFTEDDKHEDRAILRTTPFMFSEKRDEPSMFEVYFVNTEGKRSTYYNYGFRLDAKGVVEEWLYTNTKTDVIRNKEYRLIFHRLREEQTDYSKELEQYKKNLEISIDEKVLIVSLGAKLKAGILRKVRRWFYDNEVFDFSNPISELLARYLPNGIIEDDGVKEKVLDYMHSFDDTIEDLVFEKIPDDEKGSGYRIYAFHINEDGTQSQINFREESAGTEKMFMLYEILRQVLSKGSILFADELDTKLHPLLMRNIILTFADPDKNPNHAQLVFTTHNVIYMAMDILRRDEIWFTEKNDGISELFSLDDLTDERGNKIRNDADYLKHYLVGNYGAVPQLASIFRDEADET